MEHKYFYCYSENLKRGLSAQGIRYICVGINERTNSRFYLYESSAELQDYKDRVYPGERMDFINGTGQN